VLTKEFAERFAHGWVAAWNSHDLEAILAHYADTFEMCSPLIVELVGEPSGVLHGKEMIAPHWSSAIAHLPNLHLELLGVMLGTSSVVIHYHGPKGEGAEVFWFDDEWKVMRAVAHYA
jgi:hypothetical protein